MRGATLHDVWIFSIHLDVGQNRGTTGTTKKKFGYVGCILQDGAPQL